IVALPPECGAQELFSAPAGAAVASAGAPAPTGGWKKLFDRVDRLLKQWERVQGARALRSRAVKRAEAWILERLQDSDGLSAILPAMANSVLALRCLGYADDHPVLAQNLAHLDALTIRDQSGALRVQPCLSPVWDTLLAS